VRIVLDYRPALRERSGVGEFVHGLAGALAASAAGDELVVLSTSWKDRPDPNLAAELPGVQIIDRRVPVRPLTWAWNRLGWPPVEWLTGAVDVIHAQTPVLIPASKAAQVITIHDLGFLDRPERSNAEMRRDFPRLVAPHAARADHVVVSSRYAGGEVARQLNVAADRITVCSPGAPAWTLPIARERGGEPRGAELLFIGTLEPRKNIAGLLDAYARLRERRQDAPPLVLIGRITDSLQVVLRRTSLAPLAGHVKVTGYVTEDERRRAYRTARVLLLPSFEEGFGLPVLEAMACGVPVVVSNRGSLPEVAGNAARPIDPENPEAIAAEIARLLDAQAARQAIAEGLAQAGRYTWEAAARAAREAYARAVVARARRAS
jgi:glycosyltransferase involved in cell wall biosynthesis